MFNISQLCERSTALQMIECTRFSGSFCLAFSSCVHVLHDLYTRQSSHRENTGREGVGTNEGHGAKRREAHRAAVPSLQLRALIRPIVSNIETHNKHNTWRPFAIQISPSLRPGQPSYSLLGYHSSDCKIMTQSSPWLRSYWIP